MISDEMIVVVPLEQAPWFQERNLDFDYLKHIQGNYVHWKQLRITTARSPLPHRLKHYDQDSIIDFICGSLEHIQKYGLQQKSVEGQQIIANCVQGIHEYNHFIQQVFHVIVDPFFYYL